MRIVTLALILGLTGCVDTESTVSTKTEYVGDEDVDPWGLDGDPAEDNGVTPDIEDAEWDEEIRPYVERFIQRSKDAGNEIEESQVIDIDIDFGDTRKEGPAVVGLCVESLTGGQITLNREYWDAHDDMTRESLVFHELGHCALGRSHRTDLDPNTEDPVSLMYPFIVKSDVYVPLYDDFIDELFNYNDDEFPFGLGKVRSGGKKPKIKPCAASTHGNNLYFSE